MAEEKGGEPQHGDTRERERERRDAARLASVGARFIFASRGRHDRKWRGRIGTQLERIFFLLQ
jgi:hypothetical protein